ncbi:DNA-binding protein [Bosea sp. WAO]|uniref:AAA family ATPase n=1 Tax=Bosea sp. WAO TaxID=406341 RepID=UPI00074895CC|nr:AAA family ATPase [Bosea sp. WAO]KUL94627.1 DNA-binding protein [Bosea sp. WAO]
MKLSALRLHNVRRFAGTGIAVEGIGDGVNVLSAVNEVGKSTCFDALHALFFQPHTGTPGPVQTLRPYSGGNPLVEADIKTSDGAFRLTKQFYGGKRAMVRELSSGRLIAQADEAEKFIGALVQGGTTGPAGLLWVRQGITGIERRAKSEEENEKRARESVLVSVQGEVESLTGGRRMAQAVAACEEELSRLVTATRRPKAGGPYALALEERDRLAEAERKLAAEVAELRTALDRRRSIRNRLNELEDREEERARQGALAQAEKDLAAAKAQGETLKTAEAEAALARSQRDAAGQALTTYRRSLARLAELQALESEATGRRDEALARQRAAAEAGRAAAAAVELAESEERQARDLLSRLEKALRARDAAERLTGLREAHAGAEAERTAIESFEAEIRALALPAAGLRQLEALETELVGLRAIVAARMPLLRVDYRDGASAAISIAGMALGDGEEKALTGSTTLDIAEIGRITLTLPQGQDGQAELAQAEARRQKGLKLLGIASLAEGRQRETRLRELETALRLGQQRLALLAPHGLADLQESIARLEAQRGEIIEIKADPEATRLALDAAEARVTTSRNAVREAQPQREAADTAILAAERALATIASERAGLTTVMGAEDGREAHAAALEATFARAEGELASVSERVESLRASAIDLAGTEAKLRRMRSIVDSTANEIAKLREDAAEINGQIRARADAAVEEAWQETSEKLAAAEKRLAGLAHEVALLSRLRDALEAARTTARDHYFRPVMAELKPLLGLLFEDASVTFDEDTLLPRTVRRNGLEEPVGVLSGGMREQLAVLTRLAFARLLAKDGQPAPVILDDALVYSDDDRIERMFDALHRQASDQQIIVFSCRQRAFSQLGGNILRMKPWSPEG